MAKNSDSAVNFCPSGKKNNVVFLVFIFSAFTLLNADYAQPEFKRPLRLTGKSAHAGAGNPVIDKQKISLINPRDLERDLTLHYIKLYSNPSGLEWLRVIIIYGVGYNILLRFP